MTVIIKAVDIELYICIYKNTGEKRFVFQFSWLTYDI